MPRGKKHWTRTKKGKEKLKEIAAKRLGGRNVDILNNQAGAPIAKDEERRRFLERESREDFERFQRKPRELVMRVNSLEMRFYFD